MSTDEGRGHEGHEEYEEYEGRAGAGSGYPAGHSAYDGHGWEPIPQGGEYDSDATAFVHLPPEDLAAAPLAAPGHGFVPPMIYPLTPAAEPVQWPAPEPPAVAAPAPAPAPSPVPTPVADPDPHATAQWNFSEVVPQRQGDGTGGAGVPVPADLTGQWTIPVADGDLTDDSGEFTTSSLGYGSAPATLPGGAPAPWAVGPEAQGTQGAQEASQVLEGSGVPEVPESGAVEAEPVPDEPSAEASPGGPEGDADVPVGTEGESEPADAEAESGAAGTAVDAVASATVPEGGPEAAVEPGADTAAPAAPAVVPEAEPGAAEGLVPGARTGDAEPEAASGTDVGTDVATDVGPAVDVDAEVSTGVDHAPEEPAFVTPFSDHPGASYVLRVNGTDRPVTDAWIGESLLYVLRERLGLAGAKDGCAQGECGACNVQVDGRLVASCLVPAATTAGSEVRTVEGLATDGEPSDVQRALAKCGAVQCGFCIPGMAMTIHDLLEGNHAPTELETRQALCGNLCRCSGYRGVLEAVGEVVAEREAHAEAAASEEARIPHQAAPGAGSVQQPHPHDGGMA